MLQAVHAVGPVGAPADHELAARAGEAAHQGIAALVLLLVSVQGRWRWRVAERARLYRFIDVIGRWSMIDIFMISILVALVHLGAVANVSPGLGAAFFSAVVLTTMLAATTFDPRLLWDAADDRPR